MKNPSPEGVTRLLKQWKDHGDANAENELFALVERELLKIANGALRRESGFGYKIEPRELVNEAYLALRAYPIVTVNRAPFFRLMIKAMRNYLMDLARRDRAAKRPPSHLGISDDHAADGVPDVSGMEATEYYLAIDALRMVSPRQADGIELRIFGLTIDEIAAELNVAPATVKRDTLEAQAFLAFQLGLPSNWLKA